MSRRGLQRGLAAQGIGFTGLLGAVRLGRAADYNRFGPLFGLSPVPNPVAKQSG